MSDTAYLAAFFIIWGVITIFLAFRTNSRWVSIVGGLASAILIGWIAGHYSDFEEMPPTRIDLRVQESTTPGDREKIMAASGVLFEQCPGVRKHWYDMKQGDISVVNATGYSEQRDRGWNEFVEFELIVNNPTKSIPSDFHASGHHCYFRIGTSGGNPGVDVAKLPCQSICQDRSI